MWFKIWSNTHRKQHRKWHSTLPHRSDVFYVLSLKLSMAKFLFRMYQLIANDFSLLSRMVIQGAWVSLTFYFMWLSTGSTPFERDTVTRGLLPCSAHFLPLSPSPVLQKVFFFGVNIKCSSVNQLKILIGRWVSF